jgi:TusA-related sulfurtransferase
MASRTATSSLDLRGHVCRGPTVDTRVTLKEMRPIPAFMRQLGYPCELVDGENEVIRFFIEKARVTCRLPFMDPIRFAKLIAESNVVSF